MLLLLPAAAHGQTKSSLTEKRDSVPLLNGIEVSADLIGAGMMALGDYGQYEAALRVNLRDRYFPIIEIGVGKCDHEDDATQNVYKTSAPYGKIGCDFNLLKNKHDSYRVYAGFRYAFTSYKYDLWHPDMKDPVWGSIAEYSVSDAECSYHWAEAVFGVQAKMLGPVHLGWSVRYRKRLTADEGIIGKSWYVPGFGKSDKSSLGGTFNLIIVI